MGRKTGINRFVVHKEFVKEGDIPLEHALPSVVLMGMGPSDLNKNRERVFHELEARDFLVDGWVSPHSLVDGSRLRSCVIFEHVNVQPFCRLGHNVVIWSQSHIGHHSQIGSHTFVTSHVCIAGGVEIGERCFIGCGAIINDHITIGDDVIVQAGSVVDRDVPSGSVWGRDGLSKVPSSKIKL